MLVDRPAYQARNQGGTTVSIAMTSYNGSRFIEAQLRSLAAQTQLPFELVVCDDGSSDATTEMVERFALDAPFPVTLHRNPERLGYRANFMQAAMMCRGDLVAFCDQDDLWQPTKLERVAAPFDDPAVMLVLHNAELIDENGAVTGTLEPPVQGIALVDPVVTGPWPLFLGFSETFRASILDHADLWTQSVNHFVPNERMGHDRWVALIAGALGDVVVLPELLVQYRQHDANVYGARASSRRADFLARVAAIRGEHADIALRAKAAAASAAMLDKLVVRPAGANEHTVLALQLYSSLSQDLAARLAVHRSPSLFRRVAGVVGLIARSAYRNGDPWRLPYASLVKDLFVIAPFGMTPDTTAG